MLIPRAGDGRPAHSVHPTHASSRAALARLGGLVLILVVTSFVGYHFGWFNYHRTLTHVTNVRQAHSLVVFASVYIVVYGVGTAIGVPALPFMIAAGVLFGTLAGALLAWSGAMVGAVCGYWLARTVGHDVVLRWVRRFKKVDAAVADARDFDGMLRLRLIPVFPIGTVNFVGGLARAPFWSYLAATGLGIIPSTAIYVYFADRLVANTGGKASAFISLAVASAGLILLSLLPKIFGRRDEHPEAPTDQEEAARTATAKS
jgi:uncharacterized membrane protein YdjX (TVP38/TMEM64 family)